jgi:hypothetical protein
VTIHTNAKSLSALSGVREISKSHQNGHQQKTALPIMRGYLCINSLVLWFREGVEPPRCRAAQIPSCEIDLDLYFLCFEGAGEGAEGIFMML